MKDNFNFFIPVDIVKADKKGDDSWDKYSNMFIEGVASTNDEDTDEEILEPDGYMLDRFLKYGYVNYDHQIKNTPKALVGEPVEAKVKGNQFHVKAKLWKDSQKARDLYDTIEVMKKSGSNRKIGWSIEGKAIKRDPMNEKRILKALITNVALTFNPKNVNTWADIVKGEYEEAFIKPDFQQANGGQVYLLDITYDNGKRLLVDKNFNIKILNKAMSAGSETGRELNGKITSGASLKKESVDRNLINLQPDFINAVKYLAGKKEKLGDDIIKNIKNKIKNIFDL